jgi:signal peptidase I
MNIVHLFILFIVVLGSASGFVPSNRLKVTHSLHYSDRRRDSSSGRFIANRIGGDNIPPYTGDTSLYASSDNENATESSSNPIVNKWLKFPQETRDDIVSVIISVVMALLLRAFIIEPRYIPSLSMFPTFDIGDQLLVDKISKVGRDYKRRDVVVFDPPETYIQYTGNTEALIKRIVAVGGDTVEVKDKTVYVNGVAQKEEYISEEADYTLPPTKIPAGYVFVFGDNRNRSFDSHVWGLLPEKNIIGRAVLKYWPPWRVGFVDGSS